MKKVVIADDEEAGHETVRLGSDVGNGAAPQAIVRPDQWQAAEPLTGPAGYCLVSCVVIPGFDFDGFTLAPVDWSPSNQ